MGLILKNVLKKYHDQVIFENCTIDFSMCGLYAIEGESGSGKTTLLSILAGYEYIDDGEIIKDENIRVSYIFQSFELIDDLTVLENISLYPYLHKNIDKDITYMTQKLGINHLLNSYPYELSQGQKQRVAIARTLLQDAHVILCDEPTESLDKDNKKIVMDTLKQLSINHIVIIVSHDQELMDEYYDYKYKIENHKINFIHQRNEYNELTIENDNNDIDTKHLHHLLNHLFIKKNRVFLCSFMMIITVLFSGISLFLQFNQNDDMISLNDHVIYVIETQAHGADRYKNKASEIRLALPFNNYIIINNNKYQMKIYSLPKLTYDNILVGNISQTGITINQFAADEIKKKLNISYEDMIGLDVVISVNIDDKYYDFTLPIQSIIEEYDELYTAQIYYPYDYIVNKLKEYNVYDKLANNDFSSYELIFDEDENMVQAYQSMQTSKSIISMNSLLELMDIQDYYSSIKVFIVQCIEIVCIILIGIFIGFYGYQGYKKNAQDYVVIHSVNIPMNLINEYYIKIQYISMISLFILSGCIVFFLFHSFLYLMNVIYFIIYSIMFIIGYKHSKKDSYSLTIKNKEL